MPAPTLPDMSTLGCIQNPSSSFVHDVLTTRPVHPRCPGEVHRDATGVHSALVRGTLRECSAFFEEARCAGDVEPGVAFVAEDGEVPGVFVADAVVRAMVDVKVPVPVAELAAVAGALERREASCSPLGGDEVLVVRAVGRLLSLNHHA